MGYPHSECLICVFRHPRPGCWASKYQVVSPCRISALTFVFQAFPSANTIFAGIGVLLSVCISHGSLAQSLLTSSQAAKDVSASRDKLIELFNRIEHFFRRLEIYTGITPTTAMTDIIIEIMVEVLTILAVATKEVKRGRFSELIPRRVAILD